MDEPIRICIGVDRDTGIAARVLMHSILKQARNPDRIRFVPMTGDDQRLCTHQITGFSLCRWTIPETFDYSGRAIYLDADQLVFAAIETLWESPQNFPNPKTAGWCVYKHGVPATSVMVIDCERARGTWPTLSTIARSLDRHKNNGNNQYARIMAGALLKVAPEPIPDCWNSYDVYIEGETQLLHFTRIATQPWRFTKHHHAELWGEAFREAWEDGFVSDQDIELACEQFAVEGKNHGLNPSWRKFLQRPPRPDPAVKHPGGTTSPDTESYEQRLQTMPKQLAELPDALFLNSVGNPVDPGQLYSNAEAFLVLNGPSVNRIDLNRLSGPGFLTMGINNGPRAFRPHLWAALDRPSRFVPSLWLDPRILKFTPRKHLVSGRLSTVIDQPGNRIRIKNCPCVVYYACGDLDAKTFLTADTLQTGIPKFRSTSLVALRILYELGVSTVYLLGCDFNMSADNPYFFSENVPGPQVQNNNKAYRTLSGILAELKPVFDDAGFRLFNCNPDSQLDIFPFIEFDDVATLLEQKMAYLKDRESNTDLYYPER